MSNAQYAAAKINEIPGVKANPFSSVFFKEFVVDFSGTGKTVKQINKALLDKGIFGGKDLSEDFRVCSLLCNRNPYERRYRYFN